MEGPRHSISVQLDKLIAERFWVVEIRRPGSATPQIVTPAGDRWQLEEWCDRWNRNIGKDAPSGRPLPVARVVSVYDLVDA
jgi:hypothetical protein